MLVVSAIERSINASKNLTHKESLLEADWQEQRIYKPEVEYKELENEEIPPGKQTIANIKVKLFKLLSSV
jgi:hypothetical protein